MTGVARHLAVGLAAAVFAAAASCDKESDNYLDGSLTESYDLDFDDVRIRLYTDELSIEYVAQKSQGEQVALRVTVDANEVQLAAGTIYDLKTQGSITQGAGYGSPLPDLESGDLTLAKYAGTQGSAVVGNFDARFVTDTGTMLTLRGGFAASLEVVSNDT